MTSALNNFILLYLLACTGEQIDSNADSTPPELNSWSLNLRYLCSPVLECCVHSDRLYERPKEYKAIDCSVEEQRDPVITTMFGLFCMMDHNGCTYPDPVIGGCSAMCGDWTSFVESDAYSDWPECADEVLP